MTNKTNQKGIDLIIGFEGLRLNTYLDEGGVPTIAYGHTGTDVKLGMKITPVQAVQYLMEDLKDFEGYVNNLVFAALNSNQFSALVSFIYNEGNKHFIQAGFPKALNAGNYDSAASIFPRYAAVAGKHNDGLYKRRLAEQALFLLPEVTSPVSKF